MRRMLQRLMPSPRALQEAWYLRPFGRRFADPRLWCLHRRGVTGAFGAGLAICFIPLPVHMIVAVLTSLTWRVNVPVIFATIMLVNPITALPVYYAAYRAGVLLTGAPPQHFAFHLSWDWLQNGLGPMWRPFLVGCLFCAVCVGILGWLVAEILWRWHVTSRYRHRHAPAAP